MGVRIDFNSGIHAGTALGSKSDVLGIGSGVPGMAAVGDGSSLPADSGIHTMGTRSSGMGTHIDGADPATDVSGLTGARGHSCCGGGWDATGGDVQGAVGGGTTWGPRSGVLRATGAPLYTGEDDRMDAGDGLPVGGGVDFSAGERGGLSADGLISKPLSVIHFPRRQRQPFSTGQTHRLHHVGKGQGCPRWLLLGGHWRGSDSGCLHAKALVSMPGRLRPEYLPPPDDSAAHPAARR
jgi:hypothetical protein